MCDLAEGDKWLASSGKIRVYDSCQTGHISKGLLSKGDASRRIQAWIIVRMRNTRFVVLIFSLLFVLDLHARDSWVWVKFDEATSGVSAPIEFEQSNGLIVNPDEPKVAGFSIYFYQKSSCLPVILLPSEQQTTGLQLRVDEGEIYSPQWVKWEESRPIVQAMFVHFPEPTDEQVREDVRITRSFLRDVSDGNTLRVKMEPSGEVKRWSLRGSKNALDAAMGHCFAGVEDRQYFLE